MDIVAAKELKQTSIPLGRYKAKENEKDFIGHEMTDSFVLILEALGMPNFQFRFPLHDGFQGRLL
jgi:hypothetical protein